jgi:4-diphosphocytidyl-2-C-methyl-D-erythritol kinase
LPLALTEPAFAKVNLTLRLIRRRDDGYHDLDSLVVFARLADRLTFASGKTLALDVRGPTAAASGLNRDNLVLKAAKTLAARIPSLTLGTFVLDKRLPVAAGLGGGSADAAAALRLLARANHLAPDDPRLFAAAQATGADVPVCLDPQPRRMQGIGDVLSAPLVLPRFAAVLVNPGVGLATRTVFAGVRLDGKAGQAIAAAPGERAALLAYLADTPNDLERSAIGIEPVIAEVLESLREQTGCRLARMSGSGATCFGLFDGQHAAAAAAAVLCATQPTWWVRTTMLGGQGGLSVRARESGHPGSRKKSYI